MLVQRAYLGNALPWSPNTKRKVNRKEIQFRGFSRFGIILAALVVIAGVYYMYSINCSAVKGYQARQVEKEVKTLQGENEKLRIREAQLKSLYYIEETSKNLNMAETVNVSYIKESGPVAYK